MGGGLRGPELVTTAEFNDEAGPVEMADDVLPGWDRVHQRRDERGATSSSSKTASRWVRIPREREAMHFLIVGDSGTGKSAAIRQMLSQVHTHAVVFNVTETADGNTRALQPQELYKMMQMVEAFAEFERAMLRERTRAGLSRSTAIMAKDSRR